MSYKLWLLTTLHPILLPPAISQNRGHYASMPLGWVSDTGPMPPNALPPPHPLHSRELVSYLLGLGLHGTSSKCIPLIFCLNNAPSNLVFSYCGFLFISLLALNTVIYIFLVYLSLSLPLKSEF